MAYRAGSAFGGTGIIGRVIQQRTGLPLSQAYFFADGVIILAAAIVFGWEIALYGFLALFIQGLASATGQWGKGLRL
ncbi:MAG: YitT family protein [Chloroflexi bacterium]|nr:YitT family protein [Chloroflexota bacterium]